MPKPPSRLKQKKWLIIAGISAVVLLALVAGIAGTSSSGKVVMPTFPVTRNSLAIAVSERGTVKSRQQEIIKCKVEGQTTIIYLVDEGNRVQKGDLLVELDSSKLDDQKVVQQINVQNAEANFIRSRESLEVAKNQAQADVAKAQTDAQFATEDLKKYDKGDYPKLLRDAESKITIARQTLTQATEKLRWTEVLNAEKYVSQTELEADRLAKQKAQLDLEQANGDLLLLQNYEYKRQVDQFKSNAEQTAMALERAKRKAVADVAQADADLKAKDSEFVRSKTQLDKTLRMIENCKMYSPTDALVVYATTGQFRGQEPLAEGSAVRERQELIYLPTASEMMVEIKIHESNLNKVRPGLPVLVTVDALPGKTFTGRVAKIAPLPDAQSMWMNPDLKVYATQINLDGDGSALKTGMSCSAQIVVENYENVLSVPMQAVVRENSEPVVYTVDRDKATRRVIQIGLDNGERIHVLGGLKEGELVWATPPIGAAGSTTASATAIAGMKVPPPSTQAVSRAEASGSVAAPATQAVLLAEATGGIAAPATQAAKSGAQPGAAGDGQKATPESRDEMRKRMESMTPEQRAEAMRKRMESMTPEQRKQFEDRRRQRQESGQGGGAGGDGAGGGRRDRGGQPNP